jgi:hypothetical protein
METANDLSGIVLHADVPLQYTILLMSIINMCLLFRKNTLRSYQNLTLIVLFNIQSMSIK